MIEGVHEAVISEALFDEVQNIVNTKRRLFGQKTEINTSFPLKRYLICPACGRKLCGNYSQGRTRKYSYYHCSNGCKVRFKADFLNENYNEKLQELVLSPKTIELFSLILNDVNMTTQKTGFLNERKLLLKKLEEQELFISKARKLFVAEKLKYDDYSEIKKEHQTITGCLRRIGYSPK